MKDLRQGLRKRQAQSLYRSRRITESPQQPLMRIDGREVISFCSNDYLGLANHPAIVKAFCQAASEFGVGSGAAHLINGHSRYHHELEEALAEFTGYPRCLLFSTGYMANLGVVQALMEPGDAIFADRLNHASLLDGALLSRARLQRYPHNDVAVLDQRLAASKANDKLIMTDGVFSMDGDIAPLSQLAALANTHDAWLMVDDAHGIGVLGKQGRGTMEAASLTPNDIPILMGTLGKAFGVAGAFVAGSEDLIEHLIQTARSYIFTTAMPAAAAAATLASLEIVKQAEDRRRYLHGLVRYFRQQAGQLDLVLLESSTAIQGIVFGSNQAATQMSEQLFEAGFLVTAIRPPTVPEGTARLRLTLSASHDREQIDWLLEAVGRLVADGKTIGGG
jgi:8-amino-7-oxononanoate synthase